ncbi:fumarylacetoacetate hydrolase [Hymenobacter roseosalivarius DSM 11622]|uniref:fumarylacetoacetase n=1 Tax=Hymenobacter roseosalivarius DSM 11622 TaxID=645990 RepID=A0A1W1W436_9BACT|nr:fumarylacetoacetase [Hymenobacter roseosalivarius]SMC00220.1 fumarylacetoacetate hydrolase [Hymenobacter roseosalivarius DSM 11622]
MANPNDPTLRSWIDIPPTSDFPIQNLPFGVFETLERGTRLGVAIGEYVLDLYAVAQFGLFEDLELGSKMPKVFRRRSLNQFIALGRPVWRAVRQRVSELLRHDSTALRSDEVMRACLLRQSEVEMLRPVKPGNYTDFYSSIEHATNVGTMFRDPNNALLPNWRHIPIGYHGRASSIVVSGTPIRRPNGQRKAPDADAPTFGPSQQLDFELEVAFVGGRATELGSSVPIQYAEDHIFGLVLFNDWSARDIQSWEYVPLGPFLGKSFGSSISPWVVTLDALEPFRTAGPVQEPEPLLYLRQLDAHNFDINLEVAIQPENAPQTVVSRSNFRHMYWRMAQQLTHQTSNGCNLQVGDLYASGTISGPTPDSLGSMLELAWKGTRPIPLADGSERTFLLDGDTVIMRGFAKKDGVRVGFGEVSGMILPAVQ